MALKQYILTILLSLAIIGTFIYSYDQLNLKEANLRQKKDQVSQNDESTDAHTHLHHIHEQECDHDIFMKDKEIISFDLQPSPIEATMNHELELRRQHQVGNWQNIRVLADYSNLQATIKLSKFIQAKLIPAALGFITYAYTLYPKTQITELIGQKKCHHYIIPSTHQKQGIDNYDLVLYIGIQKDQGKGYDVRAGHCILDKQTNRPVAGIVEFNLDSFSGLNLEDPDETKMSYWIRSTIHEITHVLGFSSSLFNYFIDPLNNKLLPASQVTYNGYGRSWITLPNVVAHMRAYFDCDSSWGAPLENNRGKDGTVGSHWERITFGNEAMTASYFPGSTFSMFTFKLLQGSGWYLPNYDFAQTYIWGKNEGCEIAQAQCPTDDTMEFCNSDKDLCSIDNMGAAHCTAKDDPLAEGCKYWQPIQNLDCRTHNSVIDLHTTNTGGFVGTGSRCWVTSLPKEVGITDTFTSCYKSQCLNAGTEIQFTVGFNTYLCSNDDQVFRQTLQQIIKVEFQTHKGTVTCPSIARFCAYEDNCPKNCSGRGNCVNNVCQCWARFTGKDCGTSQ